MTTIYTIYAGDSPVYQGTNYTHIKKLWKDIIDSVFSEDGVGDYVLKKGEEIMFEYVGVKNIFYTNKGKE